MKIYQAPWTADGRAIVSNAQSDDGDWFVELRVIADDGHAGIKTSVLALTLDEARSLEERIRQARERIPE